MTGSSQVPRIRSKGGYTNTRVFTRRNFGRTGVCRIKGGFVMSYYSAVSVYCMSYGTVVGVLTSVRRIFHSSVVPCTSLPALRTYHVRDTTPFHCEVGSAQVARAIANFILHAEVSRYLSDVPTGDSSSSNCKEKLNNQGTPTIKD